MCSLFIDPLFSLQSPSSAGDKTKPQGFFFYRRRKGVVVGEDVFEKNEKKKKTTSVYRLVNVDSGHSLGNQPRLCWWTLHCQLCAVISFSFLKVKEKLLGSRMSKFPALWYTG